MLQSLRVSQARQTQRQSRRLLKGHSKGRHNSPAAPCGIINVFAPLTHQSHRSAYLSEVTFKSTLPKNDHPFAHNRLVHERAERAW